MVSQELLNKIRDGAKNGFARTTFDELNKKEKPSFTSKLKEALHL